MAVDAVRAKSLFLAASDLSDPAERAAYLERECSADAELRGRVEALLRANDASPLPPAGAPDATSAHASDHRPPTEDYGDPTARVGSILGGKYKLIEEIGAGGMGSVYMAQQTAPVKRAVAVKVIKAGMDSKAVLARFDAERQALAMMDHPNIARVLDAGTTDGGRPFFVMELVKGMPITQYCDERKLTPRARLELFVPVCLAIQHAHQKGIIHRDIKPSNVLVAMYDDKPVPKVIDFGVAKAAGPALTDQSLMTGFGAVVGTPEYMSPEQANLNNLDIDTRSDVYSLGVLLYELLTGTTPVDKKSLGKAALLEILRIVREVEAPRPSAKLCTIDTLPSVAANRGTEPAKLSRLMKGELDWLVMKALEKDRTRRYDTANGLARDIQRYLADEVVEARPPSVGYRVSKFVRRHKGQVIAACLVLLTLLAGLVGTSYGLIHAELARQQAEANEKTAKDERDRAERERNKAERAMLVIQFSQGSEREDTALLEKSLAQQRALLGGDDPDTIVTMRRLAEIYLTQRKWDRAVVLFEETVKGSRTRFGPDHLTTLQNTAILAIVYREDAVGRVGEAIALLEGVRDAAGKLPQPFPPVPAGVEGGTFGSSPKGTFVVPGPAWVFRRPWFVFGDSLENVLAKTYLHLVQKHLDAKDFAKAETLARGILEKERKRAGPQYRPSLAMRSKLVEVLLSQKKFAEAEPILTQGYQGLKTHGQANDTELTEALNRLIQLYEAWGKKDEAAQWRKELDAQARAKRMVLEAQAGAKREIAAGRTQDAIVHLVILSAAQPKDTSLFQKVSALQAWFGQEKELADTCRRGLELAKDTTVPETADRVAKACCLLPRAEKAQRKAALTLARKAVDLGGKNPNLPYFHLALGMAEYRSGHFADADAALIAATKGVKDNPRVAGTAAFYRAMSLFQQGKKDEARKLATEAAAKMVRPSVVGATTSVL